MQYFCNGSQLNRFCNSIPREEKTAMSSMFCLSQILLSHPIHLKMLAGDYFTYEVKADQSGGSPHCRCCPSPSPSENLQHILTRCSAYSDIRTRIILEYENICNQSKSNLSFQSIVSEDKTFCQFVLDPASLNLESRIHPSDPILGPLFRLSRDYCFAVNSTRKKILTTKQNQMSS